MAQKHIRTEVRVFERFPEITKEVERLSTVALEAAAEAGLAKARGIWPHAGMKTVPVKGYEAGLVSGIQAENSKRHIAHFHDHGTLGHFKYGKPRPTKRPRKRNFRMTRDDGSPTGITEKKFWPKARSAGRRALKDKLGIYR